MPGLTDVFDRGYVKLDAVRDEKSTRKKIQPGVQAQEL